MTPRHTRTANGQGRPAGKVSSQPVPSGHLGGGDPVAPAFSLPLSASTPTLAAFSSGAREERLERRACWPSAAGHHTPFYAGASDGQGPHALDLHLLGASLTGRGFAPGAFPGVDA